MLPAGVTFVSSVATQGTWVEGTGVWSLAAVAPAAADTLVITATIDAGAAGATIENTASLTGLDETDANAADDSGVAGLTVQGADLAVTKTVDTAAPNEGDTIEYTIALANAGPDSAASVEVTDVLPIGVTFDSASATRGSYVDSTGLWILTDLAPGAADTLTLFASVDSGTAKQTIVNAAAITASLPADGMPGNDADSASFTVQGADLGVTKWADIQTPAEGDTVIFHVTLTNVGPDVATNIRVSDPMPAGVTFVSAVPSLGSYAPVTGIWSVTSMNAPAVQWIDIKVTVDDGTSGTNIVNTATSLGGDQADPQPLNNVGTTVLSVQTTPLRIFSATDQVFSVGDPPTPISPITIRDDTATPVITAAGDLRIRIPAGFPMTWDPADLSATIAGTAAAKVAGAVTLEDADQTLVLDVLADFVIGDRVTVSDLAFAGFTASGPATSLELEVADDGTVAAVDDRTIAVYGPPALSSADDQVFFVGAPPAAAATLTIADDSGTSVTAGNDIRIRIPSGFPMLWDTADTVATIGGAAAASVASGVSYEAGGSTLVLDVTGDFGSGFSITVAELGFAAFGSAAAPDSLELELFDDGLVTARDDRTVAIGAPTIASASSQTFVAGSSAVGIAPITIIEDGAFASVTATNDLRVRIPAGFPMTWDTSDLTATIGGTAAAKTAPGVAYEDAGQTLVIDVTSDFAPGDTLTVADLAFASFGGATPAASLELEVLDDGRVAAVDPETLSIVGPSLAGETYQNFVVGGAPTPLRTLTITDDAGQGTITAASDLRLRVPAGFAMTWDASDSTAVVGGPAAAKVGTAVTFEDGDLTAVLDVTADFAPGDQVTIAGLEFTNFTAPAPEDHLQLEILDNGGVSATDSRPITIRAARSTRSSALALSDDGSELWVVNPDHGSVSVLSTATNTRLDEIPVAADPWSVAVHPTNGEVWVASQLADQVFIVDGATRTVVDSIATGFETFGIAFDPSGMKALVSASGADQLSLIDVPTRTVLSTHPTYRRPRGIAWRGDGREAWVSHLLMPEFNGRLTTYHAVADSVSEMNIGQVFGTDRAGYPSAVQNPALAPAPLDSILWLPATLLNTSAGAIAGNPLTPTNTFHAAIRPVNVAAGSDLAGNTYFLSEGGSPNAGFGGGTPVGGPIAVDFKSGRAYIANLHSENVTVVDDDVLTPAEIAVVAVGKAPIGIVAHPTADRAYVANWLSRDVSVLDTSTDTVIATIPTTAGEVLPDRILNGKQLFFTSTGNLSLDGRGACASCHVWARHDARPWDLSQFGKHVRATPDTRGIGFTGAHDWTADKNEMQDHNFGILEFTGGVGLIPGGGNPPLGDPNAGLSPDLDDLALFLSTLTQRPETPFLAPNGDLTAQADSGRTLFNDPGVGCATCHVPPFFTDSRLAMPFVKHGVGTADSTDTDAAAGFDTPSLVGVWDSAPYLHHNLAMTLEDVLTTFNPNDEHGTTSQLTPAEIDQLVAYLKSIAWPDSTGTPVDVEVVIAQDWRDAFQMVFPNPFRAETSFRFTLERPLSQVQIEIYSVAGRRVRTLLDRPMTRGMHVVGWDTLNGEGRRVASGFYYARLVVNGEPKGGKKMIVLR